MGCSPSLKMSNNQPLVPRFRVIFKHLNFKSGLLLCFVKIVNILSVLLKMSTSECDEYIRIFEYIGHEYIFGHSFVSIFLLRIYSDIRSCQICLYEYIRTFVGECVRV